MRGSKRRWSAVLQPLWCANKPRACRFLCPLLSGRFGLGRRFYPACACVPGRNLLRPSPTTYGIWVGCCRSLRRVLDSRGRNHYRLCAHACCGRSGGDHLRRAQHGGQDVGRPPSRLGHSRWRCHFSSAGPWLLALLSPHGELLLSSDLGQDDLRHEGH